MYMFGTYKLHSTVEVVLFILFLNNINKVNKKTQIGIVNTQEDLGQFTSILVRR